MRFDMRAPGCSPSEVAQRYQAAIAMARWGDEHGCSAIVISEHHGVDDGYLGSPLVLASAMAAVTARTPIMIAAAILPLYEPIRLAEEMIILDHISEGRVSYTLAVGYRPDEYQLFGVDYADRGAVADDKLATLLGHLREASTPGDGPHLTPAPFSPGGPMLAWGGSSKVAARRAGRNGLGFFGQNDDPELVAAYRAEAQAHGHAPGLCLSPNREMPTSVFVHPDVDAGWQEVGDALLADATEYQRWNQEAGLVERTASLSTGQTVAELRQAAAAHRVVTPEEAVELIAAYGFLQLQPLCGGLDPEVAWTYLHRMTEVADARARSHSGAGAR